VTASQDTPELRKARGAFFTPTDLTRYVTEWAVTEPTDQVLEPSCGEAAFLLAAGRRLTELGASAPVLHGHELHRPSAKQAEALLLRAGHRADVSVGDFFAKAPTPRYDAVIGNPPYVRYQDFSGPSRARSREAALRAGVTLTGLASSWAAFTVHSALFLKDGGRLGLVLPAELLSVNYAADVRSYLMRRFGRVRLVVFKDRVFPGVLEEVVLLLAEGVGGVDHMELLQVADVAALHGRPSAVTTWKPRPTEGKWTQALLPRETLEALASLAEHKGVTTLKAWGKTTLGAVTGNNAYFALRPSMVSDLGLPESELLRLSPPGSRHLRGLAFTLDSWRALRDADERTWLWRPSSVELSDASNAYRVAGEERLVHEAYKCRVRTPWWRVPTVPPADLLLTCMNADTPRLTTNRAGAFHLNSVHGVYLVDAHRHLGVGLLPLASLNTLTLLGAETVGRAYGGGMLKLEPREADLLPVPSPALVAKSADALSALRPAAAAALRRPGGLLEAARMVDRVLLVEGLGLSRERVRALETGHAGMAARRSARGKAFPRGG